MRISDWSSDVCSSDLFDVAGMLLDMRCAEFQRTDMGNAERWFARFGRDYLYTTAKGWLGGDGRRYRVLNQAKAVTPAEVLSRSEERAEGKRVCVSGVIDGHRGCTNKQLKE